MAERLYDVRRHTVFARGGHFPAWEAPELCRPTPLSFKVGITASGDSAGICELSRLILAADFTVSCLLGYGLSLQGS